MSRPISIIFTVLALFSVEIAQTQQLCDGNLGINIFEDGDFGSGSDNIVMINPNIAPGYLYSTDSAPPMDGFYTITNNIAEWRFNYPTWLEIGDNSEDPEGYMIVFNASYEPGLFYAQLVTGLCENTLYEFSADIINLIRIPVSDHINPNIDFLINDIVRFSTGDIPQDASWHKYGFTFTTDPGETSVTLSLKNNAPGGGGNDLALDNISFQACGPDAFITAEQTIFLCENDNTAVEIHSEIAANDHAIQWQFSNDSLIWIDLVGAMNTFVVHDEFEVGKYYYRYISAGTEVELLNEKCRIISDVLAVEVLALDYEVYDTICANEIYMFGTRQLDLSGDYYEEFTSSRGCDSFVDLRLTVLEAESLELDTTLADPLCFGDNNGRIELAVTNGSYGPYLYAINEVSTTFNIFEGLSAGNYLITITDNLGCETIREFNLVQPDSFILVLPADTTLALGEDMDVAVNSNQNFDSLIWEPLGTSPCGSCPEFSFLPTISGVYTATAFNTAGCQTSGSFTISIDIEDLDIYIPNIFDNSLNGINNKFTIGAKAGLIKEIKEFMVYDRWGNLVHHLQNTTDLTLWDGRINNQTVVSGIYVYNLVIELIDNNNYSFAGDLLIQN